MPGLGKENFKVGFKLAKLRFFSNYVASYHWVQLHNISIGLVKKSSSRQTRSHDGNVPEVN
jgi:hypothetical protein